MGVTAPLLAEALSQVAKELSAGLQQMGETSLLEQVPTLRVVDRCRCGDDFCATLYTAPPPKAAWGPGHENIVVDVAEGDFILDVVDRKIVCIEILYRNDIHQAVLSLLP